MLVENLVKPISECTPGDVFRPAFKFDDSGRNPDFVLGYPWFQLAKIEPGTVGRRRIIVHVHLWNGDHARWNLETVMVNYPADEPVEIGFLGGGIQC